MHRHKEFQQKPPTQTPPRREPLTPKFFMYGASLPFKIQENPMHKQFQGGGVLGSLNFFMHGFFMYYVCFLLMWKTLCPFELHITACDAKSACFKGSRTSCDVMISGCCCQGRFRPTKIASRDGRIGLRWPGGSQRESGQFARIDSRES